MVSLKLKSLASLRSAHQLELWIQLLKATCIYIYITHVSTCIYIILGDNPQNGIYIENFYFIAVISTAPGVLMGALIYLGQKLLSVNENGCSFFIYIGAFIFVAIRIGFLMMFLQKYFQQ